MSRGVGRRDGDAGGGGACAALAVADRVGDLGGAAEVVGRGEGQRAVGVNENAALGRIDAGVGDGERVAVRVAVVVEDVDADGLAGQRAGARVVTGDGGPVGGEGRCCRQCGGAAHWTEVDAVGAGAVLEGQWGDVFEDADEADEVVGLVAVGAGGEARGGLFEVGEGVAAGVEGLDDPVGVGAEAGDDVLAGVGGGGGEQFVVEEHLPVRPDAEPGAAGELQFDDGAGGGDDLLAFHDRVAGLDGDELALTITQVGFALDKDDGALGGGVDGGVGGGRRAGHAGLRRVLQLGRNLRADARGGYCPRGQVA